MGKLSESDRLEWFQSPRLAFVTLAKIINKSGEIISPTPTYLQEQIFEAARPQAPASWQLNGLELDYLLVDENPPDPGNLGNRYNLD
jgi:hypothetical protein